MRINILIIFFLFTMTLSAQTYIEYYEHFNEAEWDIYNGRYKDAILDLERAEMCKPHQEKGLLYKAVSLVQIGQLEEAKKVLLYGVEHYGVSPSFIRGKQFELLANEERFEYFFQELKERQEKGKDYFIKQSVVDTINYFDYEDQRYRKMYMTQEYDELSEEEQSQFAEEWRINDSIIQIQLCEYIVENGYPPVEWYGEGLATMLLHFRGHVLRKYEVILKREVKEGRMPPYHLASVYDRAGCWDCEGEYPYHGEYTIKSWHCAPENYAKFLKNRKELGLSIYLQSAYRPFSFRRTVEELWKNKTPTQ